MKYGSLFSGVGGMDLGLDRAGMSCAWQVEINEFATKVLERHWPDVPKHRDVREVGKHNLEPVDLIVGGFPCTDISNAGKCAGIDGKESGLWSEYLRIIGELRPRYVLVENVSALLNRGMDRVLGGLSASGYDAEWDCIPAAAVGAAHIRDRVFILAYTGREPRAVQVLGRNGYDDLVEQGRDWEATQRSQDRKLIAMVPGIRSGASAYWWRAQSRVGRSVDDFPGRLDRLKAGGNAVCPAVAEWIGRRIVEADKRG